MASRFLIMLVTAALVGCSLAMPPFRGPRGKGPGGLNGPHTEERPGMKRHGNPMMMLACSVVNTTSGETIKERECPEGTTCDLGPLSLELCDGTPVQTTYCAGAPNTPTRRPTLAKLACSLKSTDGTIDDSKPCPGNATCSLGPLTLSDDGTDVEAMFCQKERTGEEECDKPEKDEGSRRGPFEGSNSSEEESDSEESLEDNELDDEDMIEGQAPFNADRRRQLGGRRGGRQKRRAGARGGRRHRNPLLGLACLVVDEEGTATETRHQCQGDIGCNVGPLEISTHHGELSAFYCEEDAVQVEGDGLGLADLACQLTFDDGSVESEECPRDGMCSLGPLDLSVDGQNAEAYFCQKVAALEEDSPTEEESKRSPGRGRAGRRGRGGRRPQGDRPGRPQRPDSSEEDMTTQATPQLPIEP